MPGERGVAFNICMCPYFSCRPAHPISVCRISAPCSVPMTRFRACILHSTNAAVSTSAASDDLLIWVLRVEILSDWKSLTAALLDDAAVEARSDASTTNLLLLLKDAAHKAVGGHLVPSRQEARWAVHCSPDA